ncbi:MAG: protein phosphatase 2C domain-containing protein [Hyphomicrobiales bacterium]|uniref:protein phosphatase 2C domain-containing protein n=1 Tax=Roseibium polysiphoniae TaxID=2571221 RepID=UPI003296D4E5
MFEDDDLEGEKTYSLCLRDAEAMFDHVEFSVSELNSLMLATDGLKKSFSTDQAFFRFLRSVEKQVEILGPGPIAEAIPGPLQKATSEGSGDDITLVSLLFETNSPQETDEVEGSDTRTETSERADPAQDQTDTEIMD